MHNVIYRPLTIASFLADTSRIRPLVGLMLLVGCSAQPSRIAGVKIDVKHAAEKIMGEYDKNDDGSLSQDELAAVPPVSINESLPAPPS